jgi:DNA-binding response OmpR family regulator
VPHACDDDLLGGLLETALAVVVVGQNFAGLELIDAALRDASHRVLTTTKAEEVVVLARSIRIDVVIGDHGDELASLEQELRRVQPHVRIVRVCDPDELQLAGSNGAAIARPVSLHELDAVVRKAARR